MKTYNIVIQVISPDQVLVSNIFADLIEANKYKIELEKRNKKDAWIFSRSIQEELEKECVKHFYNKK